MLTSGNTFRPGLGSLVRYVRVALSASGFDAGKLMARSQDADVKAELISDTERACQRAAFGSPTFFVGEEIFFG
jgi:2-hydroxychromene-2-carboxylate isomerase